MRPIHSLSVAALGIAGLLAIPACLDGNDTARGRLASRIFSGRVVGPAGEGVAGATVYLVPTSAISTEEITAAGVLAGTTEAYDEPLEDAVAASGAAFPRGNTRGDGSFRVGDVPDGSFFVFVKPGAADTEHLPGGSLCRVARTAASLRGQDLRIVLSSSPSAAATYVGMTSCLICHDEYATEKQVAHRLGFQVPGAPSGLQDLATHPEMDDAFALYFKSGAAYAAGTPVWCYDYDSTRGFDKFKTSLSDPTGSGGVVYAKLWLWKDTADGKYKITIENIGNPADPSSPATRTVKMTYGGAVYKQRFLIDWPGRKGLYVLLQWQSEGKDSYYARDRKVFRDYRLGEVWNNSGTPTNPADDLIKDPAASKTVQGECLACHGPDYRRYIDGTTGEDMCDTVEDPNGEFDIDGDGLLNDLNTGCENCHGPGSEHMAAAAAGSPRWIVSPHYLPPEREVQLCNRCHDRPLGNGTRADEQPLNGADRFAPPGISRAQWLAEYTSRKGPALSDFWADAVHSKSHHQQSTDFLRSPHYRNEERLLVCSDCHEMHGGSGNDFELVADPAEPESLLCRRCHATDPPSTNEHTLEMTGQAHGAATATCVRCHMPQTSKTGAGRYGLLLGTPTGTSADDNITYFENDASSHVFDVPDKDNPGVRGVKPASAMPIPYTNHCATCHDAGSLQY